MTDAASPDISNVAVIGSGILGAQIAVQAACFDYSVLIYDPVEGAFENTVKNVRAIMDSSERGPVVSPERWEEGTRKVKVVETLEEVVQDADLVIEVVPEDLELKRKVFADLDRLAPEKAILATNSSSIPVSRIESATKRPEKCLNLHFYMPVNGINLVDIMGGTQTAPAVFEAGRQWIKSVGCIPLTVKKEIYGFCFNRVWRAVKREVLHMWAEGYVDFRDVDRAWMVAYGTSIGPFGLMDATGLNVTYAVENSYYKESGDERDRPPDALGEMVEKGELGIKTGKGFYSYPDPEFASPDFLTTEKARSGK